MELILNTIIKPIGFTKSQDWSEEWIVRTILMDGPSFQGEHKKDSFNDEVIKISKNNLGDQIESSVESKNWTLNEDDEFVWQF